MCRLFDLMMSIPVGDKWNLWEATMILVGCLFVAICVLIIIQMRQE